MCQIPLQLDNITSQTKKASEIIAQKSANLALRGEVMRSIAQLDNRPGSYSLAHTPVNASDYPLWADSWGLFDAEDKYFTDREGMDSYLVMHTLEGRGQLVYRGRDTALLPGSTVLIYCGEHQLYRTPPGERWRFEWVHFNGPAAAGYERKINAGSLGVLADPKARYHMEELGRLMRMRWSPVKDALLCRELIELVTFLVTLRLRTGAPADGRHYRYQAELENAVERIYKNYAKRLTVEQILEDAPLSKYYFMRLFKEYTGQSPYEFLLYVRINEGKRLLRDSGLSVEEIARTVGFADANGFIRAFRRLCGITPLAFRQRWSL